MHLAEIKREDLKIHYKGGCRSNSFNKVAGEIDFDLMPIVKLLHAVQIDNTLDKKAL